MALSRYAKVECAQSTSWGIFYPGVRGFWAYCITPNYWYWWRYEYTLTGRFDLKHCQSIFFKMHYRHVHFQPVLLSMHRNVNSFMLVPLFMEHLVCLCCRFQCCRLHMSPHILGMRCKSTDPSMWIPLPGIEVASCGGIVWLTWCMEIVKIYTGKFYLISPMDKMATIS